MDRITGNGAAAPKHVPGSKNEILSVTEVKTYAVSTTDSMGRRRVLQVQRFGKLEDGGDAFFILANDEELQNQLKQPSKKMLTLLRERLSSEAEQVPEHDVAAEHIGGGDD